jgi:hypothetical protein
VRAGEVAKVIECLLSKQIPILCKEGRERERDGGGMEGQGRKKERSKESTVNFSLGVTRIIHHPTHGNWK